MQRLRARLEVPVVFSDGEVSETTKTTIESNDIIAIDDEFELDDGRLVCVTHIDVDNDRKVKKALATDMSGSCG